MSDQDELRDWLRAHDYDDVADLIDEVMLDWTARGVKTRRNWWDILAGGKGGRSFTIGGRTFPVLRAAQQRQHRPITKNAVSRKTGEKPPPVEHQARWAGHATKGGKVAKIRNRTSASSRVPHASRRRSHRRRG